MSDWKSIKVDTDVYRRLRILAAQNDCGLNAVIRKLLDEHSQPVAREAEDERQEASR